MIGVDVNRDVSLRTHEIMEAERARRMDAATVGFSVSQEEVPQDRGTLLQSGFPPEERGDTIVFGYTAPYAEPMEKGTDPFHPPIQPLLEWSQRVSGSVGLGYYVATKKIPEEGIDAHPYLKPGADRIERWLASHPLGDYL